MKFANTREVGAVPAVHTERSTAPSGPARPKPPNHPEGDGLGGDDAPTDGASVELGGLSFVRFRGGGAAAGVRALKRVCDETRCSHRLIVLVQGDLTVSAAAGQSFTLVAHDMVLLGHPAALEFHAIQALDAWVIGVSEALMSRWHPASLEVGAQRLPGSAGWAKVLSAYLRNWEREPLQGLRHAFEREILGEHVMSLLSLALTQASTACDARGLSARELRLYASMREWIREQHANPELHVATLATCFGVSIRYVHKMFFRAGKGETFLNAVRGERLDAAARRLRSTSATPVSMADVASGCGFSDPGYFGLLFRRKYGVSPSAFSKAAAAPRELSAID